ncbi:hypothetical protein [Roseovarius ramblicola]|uniref:DUF1611 domain-containing protein n=1 Tax=Roseovarius ramblicola TaxID=2022336 RepID=A0ABV5I2F6_9RHOB
MTRTLTTQPARLERAKWCHATRRVQQADVAALDVAPDDLRSGDLLLVEVTRISQHRRIQLRDGRYSRLFCGDRIVLAAGDRFATDQFIGTVGLRDDRSLSLLAGGGVAGVEQSRHGAIKPATRLTLCGRLVGRDGAALNLDAYALSQCGKGRPQTVITVLGTGMNAGKTDAVAGLVNGLTRLGLKVGAIKATGTAAFCDTHLYAAAGATEVLDFTDAGMAATFRQPVPRIEAALERLLAGTLRSGCDVAVVEFADGISQVETAELLARPTLGRVSDALMLAATDALSAEAALARLAKTGHVPVALTGLMTRSPATMPTDASGLPVLDRDALADPATASAVLQLCRPVQAAE